jgi:hypothetical protein
MSTEYETTNGGWFQVNRSTRERRRICGECREKLDAELRCPNANNHRQRVSQ